MRERLPCNYWTMTIYDSAASRPEPGRHYTAIIEAVGVVRSRGMSDRLPLGKLTDLIWATRIIALGREPAAPPSGITDLELLEYGLRHSAGRLDRSSRESLEALFGLSEATRGKNLTERREAATQLSDQDCDHNSFRAHYEKGLLTILAAKLCALVDERYLADWVAALQGQRAALVQAGVELPPAPELPHVLGSDGANEMAPLPVGSGERRRGGLKALVSLMARGRGK